jgi:hypothetical protein
MIPTLGGRGEARSKARKPRSSSSRRTWYRRQAEKRKGRE